MLKKIENFPYQNNPLEKNLDYFDEIGINLHDRFLGRKTKTKVFKILKEKKTNFQLSQKEEKEVKDEENEEDEEDELEENLTNNRSLFFVDLDCLHSYKIQNQKKLNGPFLVKKKKEKIKKSINPNPNQNQNQNQNKNKIFYGDNFIFQAKESNYEKNFKKINLTSKIKEKYDIEMEMEIEEKFAENEKSIENVREKLEDTSNSLSNKVRRFDFLNKEIFEEEINDKKNLIENDGRIKKIYSFMEKNFKKLPKSNINTKDLMNTFRILDNIKKLNKKKYNFSPKFSAKNHNQYNSNLIENENKNNFQDFFIELYKDDYEEKIGYDCVFPSCGESFKTSQKWKEHYEMHN